MPFICNLQQMVLLTIRIQFRILYIKTVFRTTFGTSSYFYSVQAKLFVLTLLIPKKLIAVCMYICALNVSDLI
jgi:hypothetical protein